MEYTKIPKSFDKEYYEKFILPESGFRVKLCREDPVKFAYYMLGKKMWKHQAYLVKMALENKWNIWCLPRQTGKSITIAILAIWAAWFNKYSNSQNERIDTGAAIYIMSRTEDQAKELLLKIRNMLRDGDAHMSKLLRLSKGAEVKDFFSRKFGEPNNIFQLTFANGSFIKCVPPTGAMRGKSADWCFLDEAAFLRSDKDPDILYYEDVEPTIRQTNGKMILCSTPRGQQGFYYKIFDPYNHFDKSLFGKVWFHFDILKDVGGTFYEDLIEKEKKMRSEGNGKSFEQEYEAKFVSSSESFFDSDVIDKSTDVGYGLSEAKRRDCVLGLDYGMVSSRSAATVSYRDANNGEIVTCYTKRFVKGHDPNELIPFVKGLMERFNIVKIVADDCPEGFPINNAMLAMGWNVDLFNFTREKAETYCSYRSQMGKGRVGILYDRDLLIEMKGLQQEETVNGKLKIMKGGGLNDDLCDSLIMSVSQWVKEDEEPMEVFLV